MAGAVPHLVPKLNKFMQKKELVSQNNSMHCIKIFLFCLREKINLKLIFFTGFIFRYKLTFFINYMKNYLYLTKFMNR